MVDVSLWTNRELASALLACAEEVGGLIGECCREAAERIDSPSYVRIPISAKLNPRDADEIRAMVATGMTHDAVAHEFGVSRSQVTNIVGGRSWRHKAVDTT